jgi:PBSX family phage terminase large subunit
MSSSYTKRNKVIYEYLPKQGEFLNNCDQIPHPAYIGGFGSGKSHILCVQALREAQRPGSFGLLGANTYRLLADSTQRTFFRLCPPSWIRSYLKTENKITFKNGSVILFRAMEKPEKVTNLELDWFGLDEVGYIKEDIFKMLQSRLRTKGARHGFCVGNPAGPAHWTYDYFVVKAKKHPDIYRLTTAPSQENTFLPKQYLKTLAISYGPESPYYKRFVLGQFVSFEGAIWPDFNPLTYAEGGHVVAYSADELFLPFQTSKYKGRNLHWGRSIDFGFEHPFVCMTYVTDGDVIVFVDEHWSRHTTLREHAQTIYNQSQEHQRLFNAPVFQYAYTDHEATIRNELANIAEPHEHLRIDCTPADKDVMPGIILTQSLWRQRKCFISSKCEHAYREIMSYRMKPSDKSIKEQPIKQDDDTCDAIRMACMMEIENAEDFKRPSAVAYENVLELPNTIEDLDIVSVH